LHHGTRSDHFFSKTPVAKSIFRPFSSCEVRFEVDIIYPNDALPKIVLAFVSATNSPDGVIARRLENERSIGTGDRHDLDSGTDC